jgi:competence protein ComEA
VVEEFQKMDYPIRRGVSAPRRIKTENPILVIKGGNMKNTIMKWGRFAVAIFVFAVVLGGMMPAAQAQQKVLSLNKATVKDLQNIEDFKLPDALCKAIVDYRTKNGPFKDPLDLRKVPGMTNAWFEKLNPVKKDGDIVYDPDAEPVLSPSKC